jgi:hypothetical protein
MQKFGRRFSNAMHLQDCQPLVIIKPTKVSIMTKTRILLAIFILHTFHIKAQELLSCTERVTMQLINKIKKYNSKDLIPYYSEKENRWGYFHRSTKKIITKPLMQDAYFFKPFVFFYNIL